MNKYISVRANIPGGYVLASHACKILNISRERLRQLRNMHKLIFIKLKKSYLYNLKSLDDRKPVTGRPKKLLRNY